MDSLAAKLAHVNTMRYGGEMDDKLNRQHWLSAGLRALAEEGPDGLRIMSIAQQLGVTKGSFYWHFRNHEEYQAALLEEWEQGHTYQIIRRVEEAGGDARSKLHNLFNITVNADTRLAQAIRTWAITNSAVRQAQERVDRDRLAYLVALLLPLGWKPEQAETLARWMYCALIGNFSMHGPRISPEQIELLLQIMTPPTAPKKVRK